MRPVEPILVLDRFAQLHVELLALLEQLTPADWDKPTVAAPWSVKDVVAHLLDTDMRRLSFQRDKLAPLQPDAPLASYRDIVDFINQLNADWVRIAGRISPRLLIDLLALIGPQVAHFFSTLDPYAPAFLAVAWAGESQSPTWFDIAREYTEKWHHQQHIREAVGAPGLTSREWLHPALDTFLRALPHTYRDLDAPDQTDLVVRITGEAGDDWVLARRQHAWQLFHGDSPAAITRVELDQDTAWRLFTKGIGLAQARAKTRITGDAALGVRLFDLLAIMA